VHGSPGNAQVWRGIAETLAPHFRLLLPTLPGNSRQAPEPSDSIVAEARGLLDILPAAPITIVGHSYGGLVALRLATLDPRRVARLLLLEPVAIGALGLGGDADDTFTATRRHFDSYLAAADAGTQDAIGAMVDFWFGPGTFTAMPERMRQGLNAGTRTNARNVRATFADDMTAADLAALKMPIRLVVGERSPPTAGRIASAIAQLAPHAEIVPLPGGTHAMPQTHVAQLARMIEVFAGA
jgi:pimeloyl-ACP methyl ester carboxylesterase